MSLNFFKTKTQKTDATLSFQAVLDSLDKKVDAADTLKIDQFVQQENIHLRQHQGKKHIVLLSIWYESNMWVMNRFV